MSLRVKLTSVILAMIIVIIAGLEVFTLMRASGMQSESTHLYAGQMAKANSIEIQRRIEVYSDFTNIISLIFNEYETTAEDLRRHTYNDILESTIQQNVNIMGIFSAWLPGTIDSYDAQQGQYIPYKRPHRRYQERVVDLVRHRQ